MNDVKKTIEGLEQIECEKNNKVKDHWGKPSGEFAKVQRGHLSHAIQICQSVSEAGEGLPEEKEPQPEMTGHKNGVFEGSNKMRAIALPIIGKLLLKIKELEKCLLEYSKEKK